MFPIFNIPVKQKNTETIWHFVYDYAGKSILIQTFFNEKIEISTKHFENGIYHCKACNSPLFSSETKYKSGSGWPSFSQPISDQVVETGSDRSLGIARTEVHCARCGGHLGHVFPDGPEPTGLRYCINSLSLELRPEEEQ